MATTQPTTTNSITEWVRNYREQQVAAIGAIPVDAVAQLIEKFKTLWAEDRQIFCFGNGGSASSASHFATDLGKGASDKLSKRFKVLSLNENLSWITALANDYAYDEIFSRQLMNYAKPGDAILTMSVSGNSPNLIKAVEWAKKNQVYVAAMVGGKRGRLADLADQVIVINSEHYGRVEDAHMAILHMLCYAFMEMPAITR